MEALGYGGLLEALGCRNREKTEASGPWSRGIEFYFFFIHGALNTSIDLGVIHCHFIQVSQVHAETHTTIAIFSSKMKIFP